MKLCDAHRWFFDNGRPFRKGSRPLAGWLVLALMMVLVLTPRAKALVHASILVNAQTGKVLYAYHSEEPAHPASLTKLMTLYLTFQRLADGRMTLNQRLHVTRYAADQQPTRLGLIPGSTISVRTCILGIITHSANDAAVVLADNIAGSEQRFAQMMNQEARLLGMSHTVFYNASGLPNSRQWTTAGDMATLALSIIQTFPQYYHFFDVHSFRFHGRVLHSFDRIPEEYPGADGMKTGFIDSSGFNIVTSAVRDHHRLIGVVLGGETAHARDVQMISLLNRGFRTFAHSDQLLARAHAPQPRPGLRRRARAYIERTADDPPQPEARDWVIQIGGGFRSEWQVRRVLHSARLSAPRSLSHGRSLVVLLRGRGYRARYADLSRDMAFRACTALRDRRFTCTILNPIPERGQDLASAARGR